MANDGILICGDPYDRVVELIEKQIKNRKAPCHYYDDYIVWVWTENLGYDTVILEFDGSGFVWQTDWYEGGECRVLGFCPIGMLEIPNGFELKEG